MCRIAARTGPPVPLSNLLYDAPRSLQELAYDPHELQSGSVNVDGTGVVWFDEHDPQPLRYRTQLPPWGDQTLVELAPRLRSHIILAAVRSTTPGLPQGTAFVHPFSADGLAGTHNGWISDFRTRVSRPLIAELSDDAFALADALSDSSVLFLLALDAYRAGTGLLGAAVKATEIAAAVTAAAGCTATLTLVLADHTGVAAVNAAVGRPANSLYVAEDGRGEGRSAHLLGSEPLDPTLDWVPVPDGRTALLTPLALELP
jgi:gamma-glutamyl hercynylcysteine S-oxide hydrolase